MTDEQLQQTANELIQKYKHEIVAEGDWWYGTDEHSFNIHCPDEDGWYRINVYKVDPVTGMDNYEWMIDLEPVYLVTQYQVRNHNHTLLGEFKTMSAAEYEAKFYREQTGNPAYIEEQLA